MNSALPTLKRDLMLRLSVLLVALAALLLYSHQTIIGVIRAGRQETEIINATGRQRMLVQQFVRQANLALMGLSISDWDTLLEQRKLSAETSAQFEQTMHALLHGGETRLGNSLVTLPRVDAPEVRASLEEIAALWDEVKRASVKVLRSDKSQLRNHPDLALMQSAALRLVAKVDETLKLMEKREIQRSGQLLHYQTGILLGGIGMFVILALFVHRSIINPLAATIGKLDLSEEQHRNLYAAAPVGLWQAELSKGRLLKANAAMERLLDFPAEGGGDKKSLFSLLPDNAAAFKSQLESQGEVTDFETSLPAPDGEGKSLLISARYYADKGFAEGAVIDITSRKQAEAELAAAHSQFVVASRLAGKAEVATSVLHNVGNVLNSANISACMALDSVKKSKVSQLAKVAALMREHEHELGTFFTSDSKGKQLPDYLAKLSEHLIADQKTITQELDLLLKNIEHIKEIVTMQQGYARVSGVREIIDIRELAEDALRMNIDGLGRHQVKVIREFEDVPLLNIDRHAVLQILVNLIRNAKHACQDSERTDKQITVRLANGDGRIKISVRDNGVGIAPENLTRIFNHGFTTRQKGHGFGLHSGALAAKELGGSLRARSDGPGHGATFTLELPCDPGTASS